VLLTRAGNASPTLRTRIRKLLKKARGYHFQWSERRSGYAHERESFLAFHGYPLDLGNPRTFNEKVCWRKIHDRNPAFPLLADKFAVREYVRKTLGTERAEALLIPLLFETRDPTRIPFQDLPPEFVVKANHGSQMNLIVREDHPVSPEEIIARATQWMKRRDYGLSKHEWAYSRVPRRVLVEALVRGRADTPPVEFKLHMFHGECGLIQLHRSPSWYDGHTPDTDPDRLPRVNYFTPTWEEISLPAELPVGPALARPSELDEALEVARDLSRSLDYLRVDLYSVPAGLRVGELTIYPNAGRWKLPRAFDLELGSRWIPEHGGGPVRRLTPPRRFLT
jgi:hypothetical protein